MHILILGSAGAVPFLKRDTTMLALTIQQDYMLIDCGGSLVHRMNWCQFPWQKISSLFITHRHIDHIYGFPHLIQAFYLIGRRKPFTIYGPEDVITILPEVMRAFLLKESKLKFPLIFQSVAVTGKRSILETEHVKVSACPVVHGVPALAYRFKDKKTGVNFVYSGDTGPCTELINFANQTDLLIHETSFLVESRASDCGIHSTVADAAKIATLAKTSHLCLIHFNSEPQTKEAAVLKEAMQYFSGRVIISHDLMRIDLDQSEVTLRASRFQI
ncbi:MBL fold metallo-hydrolase [candidate division CSSED10-310 bacterium]|uniref:MBL fold metallo-hydrolase n=1 Tax=candidate division CSSED10-310 bacterium TaxID=2855610 RepID=A0ABV6Z3G7_UNCC1